MSLSIKDLDAVSHHARTDVLSAVTPETLSALSQLTDLLATRRTFIPKDIPLNHREYEKKYTQWMANGVSETVRNRAAMISLNKSYDAAMAYFRSEFEKEFGHLRPTKKVGRPGWYITPVRERRLLQGEVIAHLINIAGEQLLRELSAPIKQSKRA